MEGTTEVICPKCGEKLSGDSFFCNKCGTKIDSSNGNDTSTKQNVSKRNKKIIGIGIAVILGIAIILFLINSVQVMNLKKELKRDWSSIEGEDGAYIICILDFSDDEIEYRIETGYAWMDTTIATFDYKVISGNKIKVSRHGNDWDTINVEFNEDKSMMIVKPGLTSIDSVEYWFNWD